MLKEKTAVVLSLMQKGIVRIGDQNKPVYQCNVVGENPAIQVLSTNHIDGMPEVRVQVASNEAVNIDFNFTGEEIASVSKTYMGEGVFVYTILTQAMLMQEEDQAYAERALDEFNRNRIRPAQEGLAWSRRERTDMETWDRPLLESEWDNPGPEADNRHLDEVLSLEPVATVLDQATAVRYSFPREARSDQVVIKLNCPFDNPSETKLRFVTRFSYTRSGETTPRLAPHFSILTFSKGQVNNAQEIITLTVNVPNGVSSDYTLSLEVKDLETNRIVQRTITSQEIGPAVAQRRKN